MENKENNKGAENELNDIEKKVEGYKDISGVSTKELEAGLWYIEHREKIKKGIIIFLLIFSVLTWGYSIYGLGYYWYKGVIEDERLLRDITEPKLVSHEYLLSLAAQNLAVSSVNVLRNGSGKYDYFVKLENPNPDFIANFSYCFVSPQEEIECANNFALPQETKYIMALAKPNSANSVIFTLKSLSWERVNKHQIPDWNNFYSEHLNVSFENISFGSAKLGTVSEGVGINILEFTINNKTAYNYVALPLNIILSSGNIVVGVDRLIVSELKSGETRKITVNWPSNFSYAGNIQINPDLNISRDDIYMKFEGGVGEEK
ncbi:MAG: hypothetical protein PHT51_02080 [Patescibacteria group bacterium]|nr:hypothetical protein [Patescibacteria group bacterium]MDD4611017.1 hypothetical protein [Patescibacteria group bacterium]